MNDVDYWGKDEGEMRFMDSIGMYPPRITLEIVPKAEHQDIEAIFNFNIFEPYKARFITGEGESFPHKIVSI